MDDLDKKIAYYYRNDFPVKMIAEKTGANESTIRYRIKKLKKNSNLKRWWEE